MYSDNFDAKQSVVRAFLDVLTTCGEGMVGGGSVSASWRRRDLVKVSSVKGRLTLQHSEQLW